MDPYRIQRREERKAAGTVSGTRPDSILARAIGQRCPYCGTPMTSRGVHRATKDHILPRSKRPARFGLNSVNRTVVCYRCNHDKRSVTLTTFHAELVARNDPRAAYVEFFMRELLARVGDAGIYDKLVGARRIE